MSHVNAAEVKVVLNLSRTNLKFQITDRSFIESFFFMVK